MQTKDKQRCGGHSHSHLEKGNGVGLVPGPGWKGRKRVVPGRLGRVPERVVGKVAGQQGPWEALSSQGSCTSDSGTTC